MTDVTVDELIEGDALRLALSKAVVQVDGITTQSSTRANSSSVLPAVNEPHLEKSVLGTNLTTPNNSTLSIEILEDMEFTKPIKLGTASTLKLFSSSIGTEVTCSQVGKLLQNLDPLNKINSIFLENIKFVGNETNSIFDIIGTGTVNMRDVEFHNFKSIGIIETLFANLRNATFQSNNQGLILNKLSGAAITECAIIQTVAGSNSTYFSFLAPTGTQTKVGIDALQIFSSFVGESVLYLDPNAILGTQYGIEKSSSGFADFFQKGTDVATTAGVSNNMFLEIRTDGAHNLVEGKPFRLTGILPTEYNVTSFVREVIDATKFITNIPFTSLVTVQGNVNITSLDSINVKLLTTRNQGTPDSMFIGGWFINSNTSDTIIAASFETINLADGGGTPSIAYAENERHTLIDADTGEIRFDSPEQKTVKLNAVLDVRKISGSTQSYSFRFAISTDDGSTFEELTTPIIFTTDLLTTSKQVTMIGETVLNQDDRIRIEARGNGTTDSVNIIGTLDIKN